MELPTYLNELFFPSDIQQGIFLSILYSLLALTVLWKVYNHKYAFTRKEKILTFTLSFLFMFSSTLVAQESIPLMIWGILAYQFSVDRKYMELTDGGNLTIALVGSVFVLLKWMEVGFLQSGLLTGILMFLFFLLLALMGPMGGGDIKMMGAIGLFFTLWDIVPILLYGFLIGAAQGVCLMLTQKKGKDAEFAFGPALILGVWLFTWISKGGMFYV